MTGYSCVTNLRGMPSSAAATDAGLVERVRQSRLPRPQARRRIRLAARVTLRDIAQELQVSPMTVLRWEQGTSEPRLHHATRYRELLDALEQVVQ